MLKLLIIQTITITSIFASTLFDELVNESIFIVNLKNTSFARNISGEAKNIESSINNISYVSISTILFPETFDLKFKYSQNISGTVNSNLYNPLNHDDKSRHFSISAIPYYHKKYGGVGLFYVKSEQNSQYKNTSNDTMRIAEYIQDSKGIIRFPVIAGTENLKINQSFQAKEEFSYLGIKYLLPEYQYLPKGANIFYSKMDKNSIYSGKVYQNNKILHSNLIRVNNDGEMYGIGLQRSINELPEDELSIHLIQLSKGKFNGFPSIELAEYTAGVTYKAEDWYVKFDGLIYEAKKFSHSFTPTIELKVPKHTDIMGTISIGKVF